jgi:hypothetical protein
MSPACSPEARAEKRGEATGELRKTGGPGSRGKGNGLLHEMAPPGKAGGIPPGFFRTAMPRADYQASPPDAPLLCSPQEDLKLALEKVDPLMFTVVVPQPPKLDVELLPLSR